MSVDEILATRGAGLDDGLLTVGEIGCGGDRRGEGKQPRNNFSGYISGYSEKSNLF